jgi:hypothetical protein
MNHLRARRLPALVLTATLAAVCLAACGSSSSSSSTSSASSSAGSSAAASRGGSAANRTKLVACLKAHGVTLPSRPPGGAGAQGGAGGAPPAGGGGTGGGQGRRRGFFGGGGAAGGGFANNPKLRAAFQACGGAGGFGGRRFTPNHAAVTKFVACVKQHGYNLPAPNFSGKGPIFPAKIEANKAFQTASRACASDLRPAGGGPRPGGPPSGGSSSTTGD